MNSLFGREPALIIGAIGALIALGVGFGLPVTPAQVGLIMAAVAAILAVVTRSQVFSPPAVRDLIETAVAMPSRTTVEEVKTEQAAKDEAKA